MTTSFHRRLCAVCLAMTVFVALSASAVAQMQAPQAPQQLSGRIIPGATGAMLSWTRNLKGGYATSFRVYYAKGQANSVSQFTKVQEITPNNDSMFQENNGMCSWYYTENLGAGAHTFYVTSRNSLAESAPSNFAYLVGQGGQTTLVRFVSQQPANEMIVGESKTYSPVVQISTNAGNTWALPSDNVTFALQAIQGMNWPENIAIDAKTGTTTWTAVSQGIYAATIVATFNAQNASASQSLYFIVKKCANPASIIGTITDEKTGQPIKSGYVVAMMKNNINPNGDSTFSSVVKVDPDGTFKLMVDEGEYYVQASASGYDSEYFNDAKDLRSATTIATQCGQLSTASFALARTVVPNMFLVSGTVTDKASGNPVAPAIVTFTADGYVPGTTVQKQYATWTDQNGNYEIQLPENKTYTAYATGYSRDSLNTGGAEYLVCYYDGADEPTTATAINLTADRTDVNFQLKRRPVYQNGIAGALRDSAGAGLNGNVVAYRLTQNAVTASRWMATAQDGAFSMQNLLPGEYVLFGYATTKQSSAPGFYLEGGLATLDWSKATRITVTETAMIQNLDFRLLNFSSMNGRGGIRGHCRNSGGIIKAGENVQGANAVAGAVVYVVDANGKIRDYTFSASDGGYEMTTMNAGSYTLNASRVGFGQLQQTIKVGNEMMPGNIDIDMKPSAPSGVEELVTGSVAAYPNPAGGESLAVTFDGRAGFSALTLTNAAGVTVYSTEISVLDGANTAVLPTGNLAPGAYMIRVANAAIPVVIVR